MSWETSSPVVVPIDFSGMSLPALQTAVRMAARPELIHAVHVVPALDHIIPGADETWSIPGDDERRSWVLNHFSEFLTSNGYSEVREIVLDGQPGPQIADYAQQVGAGLIVIPSHGFHGIKRLLLGSVAEKVIRLAHCPVFVIRREDAE